MGLPVNHSTPRKHVGEPLCDAVTTSSDEVQMELWRDAYPLSDTDPAGCLQKMVKLLTERQVSLRVFRHLAPRIMPRCRHALGLDDRSRKVETSYKDSVSAAGELICAVCLPHVVKETRE
jgi:hypothetical protein